MPRTLDREERLALVTQAAWRVLARDGVSALSVRNVAAEAGLAPSSLRYVLPTQASVREHAIAASLARIVERIEAVDRSQPDWPRSVLLQLLPLDGERRLEMEVFLALGTEALTDPTLQGARREASDAVAQCCRLAIEHLTGRVADRQQVAWLHAVVDGLALHVLHEGPAEDHSWAIDVLDAHLAAAAGGDRAGERR